MAGKTVHVSPEVFEGLCALRGHPDLDPAQNLMDCLEYLTRNECYRPTADWIGANFQTFWDGWDGRFLQGIPDEATETVVAG